MFSIFTRAAPALFVLLWSTGFIGARYAMPYGEPFSFLTGRFVFTIIVLAAIGAFIGRKGRPLDGRTRAYSLFAGVLLHAIYLGGVFWAIDEGLPSGLSALIVGLQPILTAFMAAGLLREPIATRHMIGLAAGLVGVVLVLWPRLGLSGSGVNAATIGACACAVVAFAAGTVVQKWRLSGVDLLGATIWQYTGAMLVSVPLIVLFDDGPTTINAQLIFAMAWLVLVLSVGAILLLMFLIEHGAVSRVATLFYLVPPVTALLAYILFGEPLSPIQLVGMAIVSVAVALTIRDRRRLPPPATGTP